MTENPDVKVFEKCLDDGKGLVEKAFSIDLYEMNDYEKADLVLRTAITLFIRQVRR